MRIAIVGGGPGGLLFATIAARSIPGTEIHLFERNEAGDAFGFGVVFSDATQRGIDEADSALRETLDSAGSRWDPVEVRLKGQTFQFAGNGMGAVLRKNLLASLQESAVDAGARLHFSTPVELTDLADYDVVVAADGANSRLRAAVGDETLGVSYEVASAKFIWFATSYQFENLTFVHAKDAALEAAGVPGVFAAHAYPIGEGLSTFIVETDEATWRAAGLDAFDPATPPGVSDEFSQHKLERIFAPYINGQLLVANNSRWANFRTIRAASWHSENVVFLGDAVHTAHFSVGSGTKMALEDAISLAHSLAAHPNDLERAFSEYEAERQPSVKRIQEASRPSLSWWEHFGEYYDALEPWQFAFHFFSRSIPLSKISRRDPHAASSAAEAWQERHGALPLSSPLHVLPGPGEQLEIFDRLLARNDLAVSFGQLVAPDNEIDIAAAVDATFANGSPSAVVVEGGTRLTRTLAAEAVRFHRHLPVFVVDPEADDDLAETMILSGRADAVVR
jgi:anthraniloyl-CoA monooxygenase